MTRGKSREAWLALAAKSLLAEALARPAARRMLLKACRTDRSVNDLASLRSLKEEA
jgi:hypothetical protein